MSSPIVFLLKRKQPAAIALCHELLDFLSHQGVQGFVIRNQEFPSHFSLIEETQIPSEIKCLVILGGDGTLLYGAHLLSTRDVPILGVNLGHLGFLSTCTPQKALHTLGQALMGTLKIERLPRLRCRIYRGGTDTKQPQIVFESTAINEVVINQSRQARLCELDAYINDEHVTTYKADGLIIAAPTGSTAYNMAAGGPIMLPHMNALSITPICPHTLTLRPLVAPLDSRIRVQALRDVDQVMVTVDGQRNFTLASKNDVIEITRCETSLQLCRAQDYEFFKVLQTKLHWGQQGQGLG